MVDHRVRAALHAAAQGVTLTNEEIFLSAVRDRDGSVNPGYLVLFRSGRAVILTIAAMVLGSLIDMGFGSTTVVVTPLGTTTSVAHEFRVGPLGLAITGVLSGYGVLLGGVAGFLYADGKNVAQKMSTRTDTHTDTRVEPVEGAAG